MAFIHYMIFGILLYSKMGFRTIKKHFQATVCCGSSSVRDYSWSVRSQDDV